MPLYCHLVCHIPDRPSPSRFAPLSRPLSPPPPGHYGTDCSLSLGPDGRPALLRGQGYVPRAKGPRVYVYELPPSMTQWWVGRVGAGREGRGVGGGLGRPGLQRGSRDSELLYQMVHSWTCLAVEWRLRRLTTRQPEPGCARAHVLPHSPQVCSLAGVNSGTSF